MKTLFAAAMLMTAAALPAPAMAQSTYESNCSWQNGARVCENSYKGANGYESNSTSTYSRGHYTYESSRPEEFRNETLGYSVRGEAAKAKRLRDAGYKAPGEHALGCAPPLRMTARDGCQP